jgi:hypothetical protein
VRLSVANSEKLWALVKKNKMANTRVVLTGSIPDAAPAVAKRSAPARTVNRVYSTDEFGRDVVVVEPPPQERQRVIGFSRLRGSTAAIDGLDGLTLGLFTAGGHFRLGRQGLRRANPPRAPRFPARRLRLP